MAIDPYRILGLSPGATSAEVRAAYRRLAKVHHPDTAGEAAMPRFLAIQAAYETILGRRPDEQGRRGGPGARTGSAWQADATRARATRDAWRARPGRAGAAGERPRKRPEPAPGPAGSTSERKGPPRGRARKATLGSTSYDEIDRDPFDPDWSGAAWYGQASGTYWTLNPKEYADPRKHGPEYQARARRRVAGSPADETGPPEPEVPPDDETVPAGASADAAWSDSTATDTGRAAWSAALGHDRLRVRSHDRGPTPETPSRAVEDAIIHRLLDPPFPPSHRALLALLGWPPLGLALATIVGEATGCGRFAATCGDTAATATVIAILVGQLAILAILAALPRLAALSVGGTLATLVVALPASVLLSALGGSREPGIAGRLLVEVMVIAWVVGVALALRRRRRVASEGAARTLPS